MANIRRRTSLALFLSAGWLAGCTAPANSYRAIYGPGPWDWEVQQNHWVDEGLASQHPAYAQYDFNYRRAYRDAHMDIGRPDPRLQVEPPNQRYLDMIPDQPTVIESQ